MSKSLKFLSLSTKVSLATGVIYFTTKAGVWSDNYVSKDPLDKLQNSVIAKSCEILPTKADEIKEFAKQRWNDGVKYAFDHITRSPEYAELGVEYLKQKAKLFDK